MANAGSLSGDIALFLSSEANVLFRWQFFGKQKLTCIHENLYNGEDMKFHVYISMQCHSYTFACSLACLQEGTKEHSLQCCDRPHNLTLPCLGFFNCFLKLWNYHNVNH